MTEYLSYFLTQVWVSLVTEGSGRTSVRESASVSASNALTRQKALGMLRLSQPGENKVHPGGAENKHFTIYDR